MNAQNNSRPILNDDVRAAHGYHQAAEQGDVCAQTHLGWMYAHGQGVLQDKLLALHWYRKAAEQGDTLAKNNLKKMNEKKTGIA